MKGWADPQELGWVPFTTNWKETGRCPAVQTLWDTYPKWSQRRWVFVQEVILGSVSPTVLSGVMTRWGNSV